MAAIFEQSQLLGVVNHAAANAGNRTGTGAVVIATGSAAPGTHVDFLRVTAKATIAAPTNARIYVKFSGTYYLQFTILIPQWTIVIGERDVYTTLLALSPSIPLPSASYTLETNQETTDSLDFTAFGENYV